MGVNKFNSEGYYDPTPYASITNVLKGLKTERNSVFKPLVYICSPYSGDIEFNVKKARAFCRFALEMNCIPLAEEGINIPIVFKVGVVEQKYKNPLKQAEYAYSLIESEGTMNGSQ